MTGHSSNKVSSAQPDAYTVEPLLDAVLFKKLINTLSKIDAAKTEFSLIHFTGPSGTGKSRLARLASKEKGWAYLDLTSLALASPSVMFNAEDCLTFLEDKNVLILDEYQYIDTNPIILEQFLDTISKIDNLTLITCCQMYPVATVYSSVRQGMSGYLEVSFKNEAESPQINLIDATLKERDRPYNSSI